MDMVLGPIVRLQIQTAPVKVGAGDARRYRTESIVTVPRVRLTRAGVVGMLDDGEQYDLHHTDHPATHGADGLNSVSVGFTGHYCAMQRRFGDHLAVGTAGENVIVDCARRISEEEAVGGFVVLDRDGNPRCRLETARAAPPCRPFAGYALGDATPAAADLKAALQFLQGGTRGFYCAMTWPATSVEIVPGHYVALAT